MLHRLRHVWFEGPLAALIDMVMVVQSQYESFRPAEWIPKTSNCEIATAAMQQDATHWSTIKLGTFNTQARSTMQNSFEAQQNCR